MADTPELLRPAEAAAFCGVHPKTLNRWADAGKIPSFRTLGGHRRFNRAELAAALALVANEAAAARASTSALPKGAHP